MPTSSSPLLSVRGLSAEWGGAPVLSGVDLDVGRGEFVVLMGPNGSGKTTLLRCLAGFETPRSGSVVLDGRSVVGLPPHRRGIGMLFQEPALFPRRSVWENIAYGLEIARTPRAEVEGRVDELVALLHLRGLEDRAPTQLSGGERQRTALARTLAPGPSLVLLDEPFGSVDAEIRSEMRTEFRRALGRLGVAAIHVTHDREEGLFLGDRVILLIGGRVVQSGLPSTVFGEPGSLEAARFLGYSIVRVGGNAAAVHPREVIVNAGPTGLPGEVEARGIVGDEELIVVRLDSGERVEARRSPGAPLPSVGARVFVGWGRTAPLERGVEGPSGALPLT